VNILSFIGEIFKPAAKLIDDLHTSDEEKLTLKNKLTVIQNEMHSKVIDYETKLLASQSSIIIAEASGQSWMQRSWRPITMLTFLGLVVCDSFGWLASPLAAEAWVLLQIGLGGYVTGRSIEKVAVKLKPK
jgi:hypothetical protein|tara:strand:+ start:5439 stop:5831 length:393 start_codon:yes stop_codon:yes gene_type:complete